MRLEYFQLIDRIVEFDLEALTIKTEAIVPTESTIFEGHFPGFALMPGVLLIETMAQTSGWLVIAANRFARMPFLVGVKNAKFRTFVTPGQHLSATAQVAHEGSGFARTDAAISVDGKPVCEAHLTFRIMDFPSRAFRASMEEVADRIAFPAESRLDA